MGHRICIMSRGAAVQIGRPLEVYRRPADTFVARFLGNPPMNLLPARAEAGALRLGGLRFGLPDRLARVAGDVILGVRPEDLYACRRPRWRRGRRRSRPGSWPSSRSAPRRCSSWRWTVPARR